MRIYSLCLLLATCLCLSGVSPDPIADIISKDLPYLIDFYKYRHQHPEVSLQEKQTADDLAAELKKIGVEVHEGIGGYGVVGMIRNGDGPLVLYRTDMDALPLYEKTGLAYASAVEVMNDGITTGTMHACGHDMHMTTWLGTARALMQMRDQWSGTVMLIAQQAEEIGMGAKMLLDAGLYEQFGVPDYGVALHCDPSIPAGQVGFGKGYTMARADMIDIRVFGIGAHGASPQKSIDPIVTASMIVMELQTIVSRNLDPLESAVVTVGAIQGGTRHNIISDEVTLKLTVRTYQESVRQKIRRRIDEIARGAAIAAGLPEDKMPEVTWADRDVPANYNDPDLADRLSASAVKAISKENVVDTKPLMLAEDFSKYGSTPEDVPTVLFWLGTVPEHRVESGDMPGLHSPFYYPEPEKTITTGVAVMTRALTDLLNG